MGRKKGKLAGRGADQSGAVEIVPQKISEALTSPAVVQECSTISPNEVVIPTDLKDEQLLILDQYALKPRTTFIATICHTCKSVEKLNSDGGKTENKISTCGSCRMISYCSKEHQIEDWENHKQFCRIVKKVLKKESKKYLYEGISQYSVADEPKWIQIRHKYMGLLCTQLGRELLPFEKEMLLFPRICFSCRESSCLDMKCCQKCHMVSSCSTNAILNHHHCKELKLWKDLICYEHENGLIQPIFNPGATMSYINRGLQGEVPTDTETLFKTFELNPEISDEIKDVWMAAISDVATVPLSILWTIKNLSSGEQKYKIVSQLTIHLLGAEMEFEGCCDSKWETFFMHLLPELKSLRVVLIGPELQNFPSEVDICSICKSKEREIVIEQRPGLLYHDYALNKDFVKPDIICAFNCGIYRRTGYNGEDTWAPTIPLLTQAAFVITTAYTKSESEQDLRTLCENSALKSSISQKNPFRSLKPQRTLVNENMEPLMYKNQYITVLI